MFVKPHIQVWQNCLLELSRRDLGVGHKDGPGMPDGTPKSKKADQTIGMDGLVAHRWEIQTATRLTCGRLPFPGVGEDPEK